MEKLLKEVRKTNAAARELRDTKLTVTQLLLLDDMLLEMESGMGLMDGMEVIKDGQ